MPKVLVCGEGYHDVGFREWNPRERDHVIRDGWLQPLLRSLLPDPEFIAAIRKDLTILPRIAANHRPLPGGHGAKALMATLKARSEGCDLIVFMADADTVEEVGRRQHVVEIEAGFAEAGCNPPGIACVPMGMSEAWLLSDAGAWKLIGLPEGGTVPSRPEECWGARNDPAGDHPKHVFDRTCSAAGVCNSRETRERLAAEAEPERIADACPKSFEPFRQAVADYVAAQDEG